MPVKNETSTRFMDEVRIISPVAFVIAAIVFLAFIALTVGIAISDKTAPPLPLMAGIGLFAGTAMACYVLLIGYVNRDAGRRGMSRVLWTLVAIFIPNALGIVLYFVLRKPRIAHCPQCNTALEPGFGFCPACRYCLGPVCPHCRRAVHVGDKFCPYCGGHMAAGMNEVTAFAGK
jgi:hypothetical protein